MIMCDYNVTVKNLYILRETFGEAPRLEDVLKFVQIHV